MNFLIVLFCILSISSQYIETNTPRPSESVTDIATFNYDKDVLVLGFSRGYFRRPVYELVVAEFEKQMGKAQKIAGVGSHTHCGSLFQTSLLLARENLAKSLSKLTNLGFRKQTR